MTTRVGNRYPTDVDGLEFEVVEISPLKTRVIGKFNKINGKPSQIGFLSTVSHQQLRLKVLNLRFIIEKRKKRSSTSKRKRKRQNGGILDSKNSHSRCFIPSHSEPYERVNNVSAESTQNSPLTLGASVNFNINENFSYSGSTYWSMLNAPCQQVRKAVQLIIRRIFLGEYGFTSYIEYSGFKYAMKPYIGFDLESFSTFNTDEIAVNQQVQVELYKLIFSCTEQ